MPTDAVHPDASPDPSSDPAHEGTARADLVAWRAAYAARLAAPDGWWAVAGLDWLAEGAQRLGSGADCAVRTPPATAAHVATLTVDDDVLVEPAAPGRLWTAGVPVRGAVRVAGVDRPFALGPDEDAVRCVVLHRGARRCVRTYDPRQAAARAGDDAGVGWFPIDAGWWIPARFEQADPNERVAIVNLLGDVSEAAAAGRLHFEHAGAAHTLLATWSGERLFVNFRDATNGATTYGAGRFLTVEAPEEGRAWLDFHRAHHPPCAHTPYATCPLPPLENRLPFPVAAGERHP